jgi:nitrite reductase (NADH) small subunit
MNREFVTVARVADLPATGGLEVDVGGRRLAIFRTTAGEVFATDLACPHKGAPLTLGVVQDRRVFCPMHGWEFDLRTGFCREHPERPLTCYEVRVIADEVQVRA